MDRENQCGKCGKWAISRHVRKRHEMVCQITEWANAPGYRNIQSPDTGNRNCCMDIDNTEAHTDKDGQKSTKGIKRKKMEDIQSVEAGHKHFKTQCECLRCGKKYLTQRGLNKHANSCDKGVSIKCRKCGESFVTNRDKYSHILTVHGEKNKKQMSRPEWEIDKTELPPWASYTEPERSRFKETYNTHKAFILNGDRVGKNISIFNIPLPASYMSATSRIIQKLKEVYVGTEFSFKLSLACGVILYNNQHKEFRYYKPWKNQAVFSEPVLISNYTDIEKFEEKLKAFDLMEYLMKLRPDTKYTPIHISNINIWCFRTSYVMGSETSKLPKFVTQAKGIKVFHVKKKKKKELHILQ